MDIIISSATHRSGSTLLQRILNARKKTLIWGENGGCLTNFYQIYTNTIYYSNYSRKEREDYFNNGENPNNWIACMTPPPDEVEKAMIKTVKTFHNSLYRENYEYMHDLFGYKEVRYGIQELNLLRKCYPNCIIILLIRNPVNVWKSLSNRGRTETYGSLEKFTKLWSNRVNSYLKLSQQDNKMHLIRYEDIVGKSSDVMDLIAQIGRLNKKEIDDVLSVKISTSSKPISKTVKKYITRKCKKVMRQVGYII